MIQVVWAFVVRADAVDAFARAYGPEGDWARLFARHPGYRGTALLRDTARPDRYLTIDSWDSIEARAAMLAGEKDEYARLDRACAALTESEQELGTFVVAEEQEDRCP